MAMTARYTVVDGEVIAEKRSGARSLYVPDPLGSTVALLNSSQVQTNTFSYWPYGEVNTRSGSTATPFQFVGTLGYYRDSASRDYVRNRVLDKQKGRWLTQDPIYEENLYRYSMDNPITYNDLSGLAPKGIPIIPCPKEVGKAKDDLCAALKRLGKDGIKNSNCCTGERQAGCLLDWCNNKKGPIYCISDKSNVCKGFCSFTDSIGGKQQPNIPLYLCIPRATQDPNCKTPYEKCKNPWVSKILHERMHACGTGQWGGYPVSDPAENRKDCLCPLLKL